MHTVVHRVGKYSDMSAHGLGESNRESRVYLVGVVIKDGS